MKKALIIFLTLIFTSLFLINCEDNGVEPLSAKSIKNYKWSTEYVENPNEIHFQNLMRQIWGKSSDDLYICGHADAGPDLYNYDGEKWEPIELFDQGISFSEYLDIEGISSYNFWIAGGRGYSTHDGRKIQTKLVQNLNASWIEHSFDYESVLYDVWESESGDIWACGHDGLVLHYDGIEWFADTIKIDKGEDTDFGIGGIREYQGEMYALGGTIYPYHWSHFYKLKNGEWKLLDEFMYTFGEGITFGTNTLFLSGSGSDLSPKS
ncbi:MAG: hypothetical protein JEY94_17475 [Melioribacteraceae bacterium]|nr:hypothetical protein [Melioribacteraceae bacterium]